MVRRTQPTRLHSRLQALLLAFASLATPLVLLAHPASQAKPRCNGMCCRAKKSHSAPARPVSQNTATDVCNRGAARHLSGCLLPPETPQDGDVTFAPLPPAILVELSWWKAADLSSPAPPHTSELSSPGFTRLPFQPPRS